MMSSHVALLVNYNRMLAGWLYVICQGSSDRGGQGRSRNSQRILLVVRENDVYRPKLLL